MFQVVRGEMCAVSCRVDGEPDAPHRRRTEAELWADFEAVRPRILGAPLDEVVVGMGSLSTLPPVAQLSRMADFANWGRACEPAFADDGAFLRACELNRSGMVGATLDGDPVAVCERKLAQARAGWTGTATGSLAAMHPAPGDNRCPSLPGTTKGLSDKLRRLAPGLRAVGIRIEWARDGKAGNRMIRLRSEAPEHAPHRRLRRLPRPDHGFALLVAIVPDAPVHLLAHQAQWLTQAADGPAYGISRNPLKDG